MKNNKT